MATKSRESIYGASERAEEIPSGEEFRLLPIKLRAELKSGQ
jgi:hypothetical protein